jgi:EAL domain-containing protein (putative c-di-GMP-specific phosphodiesterase class I)
VDLMTGELHSLEALIRWEHPTRGLISPVTFIPLAEETGLIHRLGAWVLEEAIATIVELNTRLDRTGNPLAVSVNVSPVQLVHPDFLTGLRGILNRTGAPASWLNLEVTEGLLIRDEPSTRTRLEDLKSLGVSLEIDDFGTGYSSYERLNRYPFDAVKIDRSFVRCLSGDAAVGKLVEGLCRLANSLGIKVIAEGIETMQEAEILRSYACQFGQGYAFSPPLSKAQLDNYCLTSTGPAKSVSRA